MRRRMVAPVHLHRNAEEDRDCRHGNLQEIFHILPEGGTYGETTMRSDGSGTYMQNDNYNYCAYNSTYGTFN